jgi:DNA mismatch repair protein MSH3
VKKSENALVPDTWIRVSAYVVYSCLNPLASRSLTRHLRTKTVERFHTPKAKEKLQERAQYKEALAAAAVKAFSSFLGDIAQNYYGVMRDAVNKLATADCLLSLALVALQDGYVKPIFTEEDTIEIVDGRHPMVEALRSDPFIPNTIRMGSGEPRSKIITGPNMGGKSSAVRMVALIAIMAQIGSYVPAASVRLGMLDSILTRMGGASRIPLPTNRRFLTISV